MPLLDKVGVSPGISWVELADYIFHISLLRCAQSAALAVAAHLQGRQKFMCIKIKGGAFDYYLFVADMAVFIVRDPPWARSLLPLAHAMWLHAWWGVEVYPTLCTPIQ